MSDRLKLSDPKGDAEVERVASALEQREDNNRIRQLEQNIAALERELARKKADAAGSAAQGGSNKIGARKHASFKAISTAPSINKTPIGPTMVPIPYPVVQDLSSSVNTASTVKFNGCPVYLLDGSTQPHCTGDEPGTGKGIKSGTVSGEVKPVKGCSTVRVEGKQVVREGDACTMNGGNNPGIYVSTPAASGAAPKDALARSNPPTKPSLHAVQLWLQEWARDMQDHLRNVSKEPAEGVKGAAKSYANTMPETLELLLKAGMEQHATEQESAALTSSIFGQSAAAKVLAESAAVTRQKSEQIDLPKFTMNNAGQKAGDAVASVALMFSGLAGSIKGTAKGLKPFSKTIKAPVKAPPGGGGATARVATGSSSGVRVAPRGSALDIKSLRAKYATQIDDVSTFKTLGADRSIVDSYLATPAGQQYLAELASADASADSSKIYARAVEQLSSGAAAPALELMKKPLVKIVPQGQGVSPYSPFFTTMDEIKAAKKAGPSLADRFGLPVKSQAPVYDIYQITPSAPSKVFISKVAPTTELGGVVVRNGDAVQYVVPNRKTWSVPVHIGTIED